MHLNDTDITPPVPIPGTYNPESGISYYFTEYFNHLTNHKCGDNHKCVNVPGWFHTNTSI